MSITIAIPEYKFEQVFNLAELEQTILNTVHRKERLKEIKAQKALQTATKEAWIEYDATMANAGNIDEELELGTYQAIIKEAWEVHDAEEKLALEALCHKGGKEGF